MCLEALMHGSAGVEEFKARQREVAFLLPIYV